MEREIDYICHDCQQPVYKPPFGTVRRLGQPPLPHICRTPEQIAENEQRLKELQSQMPLKMGWKVIAANDFARDGEIKYISPPIKLNLSPRCNYCNGYHKIETTEVLGMPAKTCPNHPKVSPMFTLIPTK